MKGDETNIQHSTSNILEFGGRLKGSHVFGICTIRSPSPLPSPSGGGSIVGDTLENANRLDLLQRGPWFFLSLRERARVRGKGPWKLQTAGVFQLALGARVSTFGFLSDFDARISDFS